MKHLYLTLSALILSACSIQGMVEKTVPENVLADHAAHIDKLLERDTTLIAKAFELDLEDPETQELIAEVLANVPKGDEIRRDYVGMNNSTSFSAGEGKSRQINLVSEIQTQSGFMTVTSDYSLDEKGECCRLTNIHVQSYETSPVRETLETFKKVAKIIGIIFLIAIFAIILIIVRVMRKKKAKALN